MDPYLSWRSWTWSGTVLAILAGLTLRASVGAADPLPVVVVAIHDLEPPQSRVADAIRSQQGDDHGVGQVAQHLEQVIGRFPPQDDVLAPVRQEIDAAIDLYYRSPRSWTTVRERLDRAAQTMEGTFEALDARPENLPFLAKALAMMARLSLEARHAAEADQVLVRILRLAPSWAPDLREFPPQLVQRFQEVRTRSEAQAHGQVIVQAVGSSCQVQVDGRATPPGSPVSLLPGSHRASVRCGAVASRTRPVQVEPGSHTTVVIDCRQDAVLDLRGGIALRYQDDADAAGHLVADATQVGRLLAADRVVVVGVQGTRILDVATGRLVDASIGQATELARAGSTTIAQAPHEPSDGSPPRRSGPGAGPWVLAAAGVAGLAAGIVLNVLRANLESDVQGRCFTSANGYTCLPGTSSDLDRIRTYEWSGAVGLGVGGAAIAGGLLWLLLGRPTPPPVQIHAASSEVMLHVRGGF